MICYQNPSSRPPMLFTSLIILYRIVNLKIKKNLKDEYIGYTTKFLSRYLTNHMCNLSSIMSRYTMTVFGSLVVFQLLISQIGLVINETAFFLCGTLAFLVIYLIVSQNLSILFQMLSKFSSFTADAGDVMNSDLKWEIIELSSYSSQVH